MPDNKSKNEPQSVIPMSAELSQNDSPDFTSPQASIKYFFKFTRDWWEMQQEIKRIEEGTWISFDKARAQTALKKYELTRACNSGKVRAKGRGKGRLVHSADLARYMYEKEKNESDKCPFVAEKKNSPVFQASKRKS